MDNLPQFVLDWEYKVDKWQRIEDDYINRFTFATDRGDIVVVIQSTEPPANDEEEREFERAYSLFARDDAYELYKHPEKKWS